MNGIMQLSVCCLVLCAGCQATDGLTGWMRNDGETQPYAGTQDPGGLPPASRKQGTSASPGFPDTASKHVEIGQQAIASWYEEEQPHHLETARMHFEEALRIKPKHAEAHQGLGIVADLRRDFDEAELHYRRSLTQAPDNPQTLANLGYSYLLQNRLRESEQHLLRALQADPEHRNATKHLGDVYARQGKTDLAAETYRKVLSPEQAEQALAQNASFAPPSRNDEKKNSLLGSVLPAKAEREQNPTREILELMEQERREAEQRREQEDRVDASHQFSRNSQPPPYQPPPRMNSEDRLKQELATIDRERHTGGRTNGPILIDSRNGGTHQVPDIETAHPWAADQPPHAAHGGAAYDRSFGQHHPHPNQHAPHDRHQSHLSEPTQRAGGTHPASPHQQDLPAPSDFALAGNAPASWGTDDPLAKPWSGTPPSQPGPSQPGPSQPGPSQPGPSVDPAFHQQPSGEPDRRSSVPPNLGSVGGSWGEPPGRSGSAHTGHNEPASGSGADASYEEASKAAARMGMGLGPGTMFPVFGQSASLRSSGSSSHWGEGTYPAPHRVLPTDLPPPDLRRAFEPETRSMSPPANQQGQRMPDSRPPLHSQEQFGTASRYDEATLRGTNVPSASFSNPELRAYDQQRQQADQQLNQAMNQAWGQGAMNRVTPAVGESHSSPGSGVQGGMTTESRPGQWTHPPSWPSGTGIEQASGWPASPDGTSPNPRRAEQAGYEDPSPGTHGSSLRGAAGTPHEGRPPGTPPGMAPSGHPPGVVVPAPYESAAKPDEPAHATRSGTGSAADWPIIIPGNR
jgi:hypothetical protein